MKTLISLLFSLALLIKFSNSHELVGEVLLDNGNTIIKTFTCHAEYVDLIRGTVQILPSQDGATCHKKYEENSIIDNSFICCEQKCIKAKSCNHKHLNKLDEFVRNDFRTDL